MRIRKVKLFSPLMIVWLALTSTFPFIFYSWPGHPYKVLTFLCLAVMLASLLNTKRKVLFDLHILLLIIMQVAYYAVVTIAFNNYSNINLCIQLFALYIIVTYISNFIGFNQFVKSYIYFILLMGIGGVITFFIHLFIGIPPIFEVQYSQTGITYFLGLTSTNAYVNLDGIRFMRYAGFFDEPGAFALYSIFAILLNKIYFDNKKLEYLLIIVTIFTFSLAFYIIIVLYYFLFSFKLRHLRFLLPFFFSISILYVFMINYDGDNTTIKLLNKSTFERFKIEDNNDGSMEERVQSSLHDKKLFLENPILGVQIENITSGNNFYSIFAKFGFLGSLFYYAFLVYFLLLIFKLKGFQLIFYMKIFIVILMNFFHRPEFSSALILLVIYSMIKFINMNKPPILKCNINVK